MRQAWHIFKKDVRYLLREIGFLLALALALLWMGARGLRGDISDAFGVLVTIAAAYTIARLFQAEALPGENQFWITRPYNRWSLLAAKLMFVLAFIQLPIFLAQGAVLVSEGFPVAWILPGLVWMQVLVLICVVLPLSVVAALTDSLAFFFGCILIAALIGFGQYWFTAWTRFTAPAAMEWLHDAVGYAALALFAPPILILQYRLRRTWVLRAAAIVLTICGGCAYLFITWRTLFPLQARLSAENVNVQVTQRGPELVSGPRIVPLGRATGTGAFEFRREGTKLVFNLPVVITGVPDGAELQIDSFGASLETQDGRAAQLNNPTLNMHRNGTELAVSSLNSGMRGPDVPKFLLDNPREPTTLRASFYITLFGNSRQRTITLRATPTDVMDGIQCFAGYLNNVVCRAPFRWPGKLVSQRSGRGEAYLTHLISYSPFPATLDLAPVAWEGTAMYSQKPLEENREVTIEVQDAIAYLRRDVEVRDLHLDGR